MGFFLLSVVLIFVLCSRSYISPCQIFAEVLSSQIEKPQIFFFHSHFTFQLLDKPWSHVSSLLPPRFLPSFFFSLIGFSNPLVVDFSSSVANSRSRAFRKSICAQEKVPPNLYEYALGGARTHETDLYQARG